MKTLSRLSPYTRFTEHEGVKRVVDAIESQSSLSKVSAVDIYGDRGVGKSILSYALYGKLVRNRGPSELVTYFAFDVRDHRRRSVSAMLVNLIGQLLSNEPSLIDKFLKQRPDNIMCWAEGNLWIQLRSTIRQMQSSCIHLVIDSVNECDTDNRPAFLRDLFDLRFAAPGQLKIWCTSTTKLQVSSSVGLLYVEVDKMPEFELCWSAFQGQLADVLASESPKFEAVKECMSECLDISEGFLHANLIAHRIRGISSLSRMSCVKAELSGLKKGWKDTITAMVHGTPSWTTNAVSWMMFARRPLKPTELAVGVALLEAPPAPASFAELDESLIPRDIEGDMRRQLGPLVKIERGEIRIAHSYVAEVLQEWIDPTNEAKALRLRTLTRVLLEYLHQCFRKAGKEKAVPGDLAFSLFEYALEHWHVHYRKVMDNVMRPETLEEAWSNNLEQLARTLFDKPEYMYWLASWKYLSPGLDAQEQAGAMDCSESLLRPVLLTARLGLFGIFAQIFDPDSEVDRLDALQIACRNGHLQIVQYLIEATNNTSVIEGLLSEACERGDEHMVLALIDRLKQATKDWNEIPPRLLIKVCRIGHASLAESLIRAGAKVSAYNEGETPPLHAAIKQGHLDVVKLLIREGADVNCVAERGWTPLQYSISSGYSRISDRLLKENGLLDNINEDHLTSAHLAARLGDVDLLGRVIGLTRSELRDGAQTQFSQPLHEAAGNGHLEAVKLLLEHKAPINYPNSEGKTALFIAISKNHVEVVDYLLGKNATVTIGVEYPESALKQAIIHGNLTATKAILRMKEDPDGGSCTDSSPLTDAARLDHLDIFRELIYFKAEIGRQVENNEAEEILDEDITSRWTPAHFSAYYGSTEIMRLLIDLKRDVVDAETASVHTPLHLAVFREKVEIVDILLSGETSTAAAAATAGGRKGSVSSCTSSSTPSIDASIHNPAANVNAASSEHRTPLHIAATNESSALVKRLLEHGAFVRASDRDGKTPLHFAAASAFSKNLKDIMSVLLSAGADPNARDGDSETPLHCAAQGGNVAAASLLLRHGSSVAVVNDDGLTPLYLAAQADHPKVVEKLVEHDADANTANRRGYTALHIAAFEDNVKVVNTLLRGGANSDAVDDKRDTPLHEAARRDNRDVVKSLIKDGADLNVVNVLKITPLQRAVLNNWPLTTRLLLEARADPNIHDEDGDTALTAAIFNGSKDVLDELLKKDGNGKLQFDVDLDFKDERGKTPLMRATWMPQMMKDLLDAGADASLCDNNGWTVLHELAVKVADYQVEDIVVPLLSHEKLKAKDQLKLVDNEGLAPIHLAARHGKGPLIKAFHALSDDSMSAKDHQGRTAMHHAVRTLSKESLMQIFGDFLTPREGNDVNVPDLDGWTPLHWACRGSRDGVMGMLLSRYKHPIRALRYEGKHGWTAMAIALFHQNHDVVKFIQRRAMAMDPEWNGPQALSPFSLPEPPASAEEAFQGRDDGGTESGLPTRVPTRALVEWERAVRCGLRSDGKIVVPGATQYIICDDCNYLVSFLHHAAQNGNINRAHLGSPSTASVSNVGITMTSISVSSATGTTARRIIRPVTTFRSAATAPPRVPCSNPARLSTYGPTR